MQRRIAWISAALLVICAGLLYLLWPDARELVPPTPEPPRAASGAERDAPDPIAVPTSAGQASPEGPSRRSPDPRAAANPRFRRPTLGLSARNIRPLRPGESPDVDVTRFAVAWERHLAPLLYPEGHPEAGMYRDSVDLEQAVEAQLDYYDEVLPEGYMDRTWYHVQKRIPYAVINDRQKSWDLTDPESNRAMWEWIQAQPEDPNAYEGDFWIPADPSDPQAVTRRDVMERKIRAREAVSFEEAT